MINPSRRKLLAHLGAWPLLWPLVRGGKAYGAAAPKRVIIVFSPNGPTMQRGLGTGTETDFTINDFFTPLQRHKAEGVFFNGIYQAGVPFGKHNEFGHQSGGTGALTARTTEGTNNATGPSLDQFIGQELQKSGVVTPKRSLLWGFHKDIGNWGPWYEAAGKPTPPQNDPYKALADIVPGLRGSGPVAGPDKRLVRKHFVLDSVYKDCRELVSGLGTEGKAILDFHCTNIESLEKSVAKALEAAPATPTIDCSAPAKPNTTLPATANFEDAENRDEVMKAFIDLMALSFTCDVTRVIGFSFGSTSARFAIPSKYGIPSAEKVDSGDSGAQHHAWTHIYNTGADKLRALKGFYNWYAEQVAKIVDKLKTTMDADGKPLLASTLVLWTSELGAFSNNTEPHANADIPVSLFGNSGGAFKTGRLYKAAGGDDKSSLALHALFVSLIRHTGLSSIDTFGNQGKGGLDWLAG